MKHYEDFSVSGYSFAERMGNPSEFDAAIGRIALAFSELEDTARRMLVLFSRTEPSKGQILFSGLSFRQKLDVVDALIRDFIKGAPSEPELDEIRKELIYICRRGEELRNTYLHSSYGLRHGLDQKEHTNAYQEGRLRRAKSSTRGGTVGVTDVEVNPALLLDVAEFINHASFSLTEAPIALGLADGVSGSGWTAEYSKGGKVLVRFDFPD